MKTPLNRAYIINSSEPTVDFTAKHHTIDITTKNGLSSRIMMWFFMRFFSFLASVALVVTFSQNLFAQSNYSNSSNMQSPASTKTKAEGYLRFEGMQYETALPDNPQLNSSLLASANLKVNFNSERMHNAIDLTAGKYVNWGGSQFTVNQLYGSAHWNDQKTQVAVGRKLEFWSQVDQDWQLGLWQPKSLLDALRPEDQGLTGIFFKHEYNQYDFLIYGSPIFIPTMGPSVKEKNGSLVADSRWYRAPSPTFSLNNTSTPIAYSLDVPELGRLVRNPGGGMRLRWGANTDGLWMSANAGYKPINALLLKYKKSLFLPETDPQTGEVTVTPDVGYHYIWGSDVGYRYSSGMASVSYIEDSPDPKMADESWVVQNPRPLRALAFHADTAFDTRIFAQPVSVSINYLHVDGAQIKDFDSEGIEQGAIFDQRLNFNRAASVKVDFQTRIFDKSLTSSFKYMREFEQKGSLINGEVDFYPHKSVAVILGADILGVDDGSADNTDSRFLNEFRANDRVYGGMSYVF